MIRQVILFVTSKCNLRCRSCFYLDNLNLKNDLSMDELSTLIGSFPKLHNIIVTGGEPFLRPELPEILERIKAHQPDLEIHLNTNGTFPDKLERIAGDFLESGGKMGLNISLDGPPEVHNMMRGAEIHHKAMESLRVGTELKKQFPHMYFTVNALLSPETVNDLPELMDLKKQGIDIDFLNIEIRRKDEHLGPGIPDEDLKSFYQKYLDHIRDEHPGYYEITRARLEVQYAVYTTGAQWGYPCNAGEQAVVVYHDGTLAPCEMLDPVLNLRDCDFDLQQGLASEPMTERLRLIRQAGCSCTHGCWLLTSLFDHLEETYGDMAFEKFPDRKHRVLAPMPERSDAG